MLYIKMSNENLYKNTFVYLKSVIFRFVQEGIRNKKEVYVIRLIRLTFFIRLTFIYIYIYYIYIYTDR